MINIFSSLPGSTISKPPNKLRFIMTQPQLLREIPEFNEAHRILKSPEVMQHVCESNDLFVSETR